MLSQEFFSKFINGYLLGDLETLRKIKLKKGQSYGGCGYPYLMTILSGIELLGTVLYNKELNPKLISSKPQFMYYWKNFLNKYHPLYSEELGKVIYQLVRHGLAHMFLPKSGVNVTGRFRGPAIQWNKEQNHLVINIKKFHQDFENSYKKLVYPIIFLEKKAPELDLNSIQLRINEIIDIYSKDSRDQFRSLDENPIYELYKFNSLASQSINITTSGTVSPFDPNSSK